MSNISLYLYLLFYLFCLSDLLVQAIISAYAVFFFSLSQLMVTHM